MIKASFNCVKTDVLLVTYKHMFTKDKYNRKIDIFFSLKVLEIYKILLFYLKIITIATPDNGYIFEVL